MLNDLPFEIQLEIMKRVPVKSLIQFRSISKKCKSLIDSSVFVSHYSSLQTHLQHILVAYEQPGDVTSTYISITDDETFPQQKLSPNVPLLVSILKDLMVIGSSHGLVCLYGVYSKKTVMVVLWNLSIRKAVPVVVPNVVFGMYGTVIGFGVCRVTTDPKVVKITYVESEGDIEKISCVPWQVEVFTLSTGAWRSPYGNVPRKTIKFDWVRVGVVVDGFLYWLAMDRITMDGGCSTRNLVISFDITTEEFREVNLPVSLANEYYYNFSMSKLRESLVVLQHGVDANSRVIGVWMMDDGVAKSFVRLYSVNVGAPVEAYLRGFRKNGEPIIQICENYLPIYKLMVFDPYSKQVEHLGINGVACTFFVYPYIETLLLLDQPNLAVCNEMEIIEYLDALVA